MPVLILRFASAFLIIATLIPFIKWDYWWIRIFDYPQLQKLVLIVICITAWLALPLEIQNSEKWTWLFLLLLAAVHLFQQVKTFSPIGKKMIETVPFDQENGIHLMVSNVYQFNKSYDKLVDLVLKTSPDLVFLVETDQKWKDGISKIEEEYENKILIPLDNTYGMLLYTRLEIVSQKIEYLIDDEIPSIELELKLKSGKIITVYAIHPTPPVPNENPKSTERDAEILIVGKKAKANKNPSLVIGDLNDVAWSYTTELFLKVSEMSDPRRGRGLFSTYNAKIPLFRWPLDHVFLSKQFGLTELKVMPSINSDHFPISMKAVITSQNTTESLDVDGEDKKEANEKIKNGLLGI
ncbi:endonuclease/exonuclease/phosphatase family protein [Algoriphagus machipongonensis]|uniref:Endonuclease/exonuclease/phosphatase n=1 Tax=Algoriphagus machipongonensis TaxID=388413 RepID=A3I1D0_9BACT|nr:endonuclease/exonuclease/phosphatase family protein [Algoriphagus machipongonensis]EAZ79596.1 endonuclease/exonuclease/phosphatase [Algoriphagus machipongonensis]